ncbi:MAG: CoA transferase [Deltaproteobacteria bacterium]|nr:CoA transferase [Deltaproteobacteria bacterium]MBW2414303.1 CoA transferase [Deltaproteobacteria bacterium]
MTAPLEGIRVVEIASFVAAPAAGALLADLGADVVKVEVPQGEIYRYATPRTAGYDSDFSEAPHFHMDNRGKRSLTMDLSQPAARAALDRVIDGADVVLTNMLPERLERFGLDGPTLCGRKPGLVFASLSGYGLEGEERNNPAFDYTAFWARSGLMHQMHEPDSPPAFLRPGVGDHSAALSLTTGILAALRVRDQTGVGQQVAVSLLHIGYYIQGNDAAVSLVTRQTPPRHDRRSPRNPVWNHYPVKGGRWLFLVMIESDRYFPLLCQALERPELAEDERFTDAVARYRNRETLVEILDAVFIERTLDEWETILGRHRLIWSPVRTLGEAVEDEHAHATGMFGTISHPSAGDFRTIAPPLKMSGHPMPGDRPAPELGADAEQVLREAGLSPDEIKAALGRS